MRRAAMVFSTRNAHRLPPTAPECRLHARRVRRASAPRARPWCECAVSRCPRSTSSCAARNAGGKLAASGSCERALGVIEAADEQQPPHFEIARVRRIGEVAMSFERRARRFECFRRASPGRARPAPLPPRATTQRARASGCFVPNPRAAPRSNTLGPREVAELRHRDATQRERGCDRREVRPVSTRRADRPRRAHGPRRVIKESNRIPPNLSLPLYRMPGA